DRLGDLMRQRTMDGPAGLHRQRASVALNNDRQDRGSGEFLVFSVTGIRLGLDGAKRRRQRDQALDSRSQFLQRQRTKRVRYLVIGFDLLEGSSPAQPLTEVRPALKA